MWSRVLLQFRSICLVNLPMHFFSKVSLFALGNTLGTPLRLDATTITLSRPSVARVCIEMDLLKKFLNCIWIGNWMKVIG